MSSTPSTTRGRATTPGERGRFLKSLAAGNTARKAAQDAGRHFTTFYGLRDRDEDFAAHWLEAEREGTQALEQVAIERAKDQSDRLIEFLLKRRDPAYRESHRVEVTGENGGAIQIDQSDVAQAIERFTSSVVRLAARNGTGEIAGDVERSGEDGPGVRLAELVRTTESEAAAW